MPKFCSEDCEAICDSCIHYRDEYEEIEGLFAGIGICDIDNTETLACDGSGCEYFECWRTLE